MSEIDKKYNQLGGANGFLGAPTAPEQKSSDNQGYYRLYEHGVIYWHKRTGAHEVHGAILERWQAMGSETGALGYPVTDETATPDGKGRFNHFQFGSLYWHPGTGAHDVQGLIRSRWAMFGWEKGFLGYPVSNQISDAPGVVKSRFQGGWISWDQSSGEVRAVRCPSFASPNYVVPVYALRAMDNDGTSRPADITQSEVREWIERANRVFEVAGIEFTYDGALSTIKDTDINSVTGEGYSAWEDVKNKLNEIANEQKKLVIVFRHGPDTNATGGGFSSSSYDFVIMPGFKKTWVVGKQNIALLAHEIGHYMGLSHTFGAILNTVEEARLHFLRHSSNPSVFDGDAGTVSDTPPDPYISELKDQFDVSTVILGGVPFKLARDNAMSYYHIKESNPPHTLVPRTFTRQQVERVRKTLVERRERGTLEVQERWGEAAEMQVYGWTYEDYRKKYDEIWDQGWRLHLLEPYAVGNQLRYTAVWRWGAEDEIQVYGWTYQRYREKYDELWPQGWRIHILEPYVVDGKVRYTAVWRKSTESEIQVYGWTYDRFREKYDELWPQGWRLHTLVPYVVNGNVHYTAVWRKGTDPEIQLYGWTYRSFRKKYDELWPQGWRLHILEPYVVSNRLRYIAVFRKGTESELQLYGWKYNSYRNRYDQLWPENWRLHILNVHVLGSDVRYTTVFRPLVQDYSSFNCVQSSSP